MSFSVNSLFNDPPERLIGGEIGVTNANTGANVTLEFSDFLEDGTVTIAMNTDARVNPGMLLVLSDYFHELGTRMQSDWNRRINE
jgi:hypothetical protein